MADEALLIAPNACLAGSSRDRALAFAATHGGESVAPGHLPDRIGAGTLGDGRVAQTSAFDQAHVSTIHSLSPLLRTDHARAAGHRRRPRPRSRDHWRKAVGLSVAACGRTGTPGSAGG